MKKMFEFWELIPFPAHHNDAIGQNWGKKWKF